MKTMIWKANNKIQFQRLLHKTTTIRGTYKIKTALDSYVQIYKTPPTGFTAQMRHKKSNIASIEFLKNHKVRVPFSKPNLVKVLHVNNVVDIRLLLYLSKCFTYWHPYNNNNNHFQHQNYLKHLLTAKMPKILLISLSF